MSAQHDVVIIGGGAIGLWAAYYLKTRSSACRVAVVERDFQRNLERQRRHGVNVEWLEPADFSRCASKTSAPQCSRSTAAGSIPMASCRPCGARSGHWASSWSWTRSWRSIARAR